MYIEELVKSNTHCAINQIPIDYMEEIICQYHHLFNHRRNQIMGMRTTAESTGRNYFSLRFKDGIVDGYKFDSDYPMRTCTYVLSQNLFWCELDDRFTDYSSVEIGELL